MTKSEVIDWIVSQKLVEKLSTRFSSQLGTLKEDWIQEMYLTICEMNEEKLVGLFERNQLVYYIISVCKNQALYPKSDFNKRYNDDRLIISDLTKINIEYEQED